MEILNKIRELRKKRENEALETAKELATFDQSGKPKIRKISKEVGKKLLMKPAVRIKCGDILLSSLKNEMLRQLNSRIPEGASKLEKAAMGIVNSVKSDYHAKINYARYMADSSLLGYIINRAEKRFGPKKQQNTNMVKAGSQRE